METEVIEQPEIKTDETEVGKTYSETQFRALVDRVKKAEEEKNNVKSQLDKIAEDDLKAKGELQTLLDKREKDLEEKNKALDEANSYKTKFEELDNSIRKNNLDKLEDDELRDIADALPTEKLIKFVEKHAKAKDGMDTGRPGGKSKIKTEGKEWADFNSSELSILRETDFTAYSKLYKEKYKVEPTK